MSDDHPCYAALQSAYRDAGGDPDELPRSESLSACEKRTTAYYENVIRPQLESGRSVLVAAHNNVIRTLMHHLDRRGFGEVDQGACRGAFGPRHPLRDAARLHVLARRRAVGAVHR